MNTRRMLRIIILLLAFLTLFACSTWNKLNRTEKGAVIGGGTGVLIGSEVGGTGGAIVGGAAGAAGGGLIGHAIDDDD